MRRLLAIACLLLTILLANLALAATRVVLWHSYRLGEKDALISVVDRFNKSQAAIQIDAIQIPYTALADKISAAIPRGHGPDLFIFAHDRIGDWAKLKAIAPIETRVNDKLLGLFFDATVRPLSFRDSLYGLPMAFKSVALFYNTKLVKRPPKTTKELLEMGERLTDRQKGRYGLAYEVGTPYYHAAWLYGFGGGIFKNKQIQLARAENADSFAFARSLIAAVGGIVPRSASSQVVTHLFNKGQAAMVINGPWFIGELKKDLKYKVAPLPTVSNTGLKAKPWLTVEAIIMSAKSKHKNETFKVMTYLTANSQALTRCLKGRQTVANKSVYLDPRVAKDPVLSVFQAQMKDAVPMNNTPAMRMVWQPLTIALNKAVRGRATPGQALMEAQRKVRSYLKRK